MGKMSRRKGAVGEREFAAWLREKFGAIAIRGCQFKGGVDSPDVEHDIEGIHFEVKRTETLSLYKAMEQAIADCGENIPVVAHRRNRRGWLLVMRADDCDAFAERIIKYAND